MIQKQLIRPDRLRQVPPSFSWVDHRLVRHHHISRCDSQALALYLFLVVVADAQGLSYYSEAALCRHLNLDTARVRAARHALQQADLIAYRKPLYQVLSLEDPLTPTPSSISPRGSQVQSVGDILRRAIDGGRL